MTTPALGQGLRTRGCGRQLKARLLQTAGEHEYVGISVCRVHGCLDNSSSQVRLHKQIDSWRIINFRSFFHFSSICSINTFIVVPRQCVPHPHRRRHTGLPVKHQHLKTTITYMVSSSILGSWIPARAHANQSTHCNARQ